MSTSSAACLCLLLPFLAVPPTTLGQSSSVHPEQLSVAEIVRQARDAVVQIVVTDKDGNDLALGSGFIVSADGKIVTNFHVIKGAHSAVAKLANGSFFPVDGVLATAVDGDLVLLKVQGKGLPFLNLSSTTGLQVGDRVVAIGSPLGLEGTVSDGIVSALRSETPAKNWIQTTAPVSHGNSGGPLLDVHGNVVGVITWGVNLEQGQNLNFATPADKVQSLLAMHEQLSPIEAVASIPTQEVEASSSDQANSPNTGEQRAIEQLRVIADAIKSCPPEVYKVSPDIQAVMWESTIESGPPESVTWDVVPNTNSIRARFLGSVEYLFPSDTKWASDMCSRVKKKRECNDDYWHVFLPTYNREVAHPQQYRYEFEVTPNGLELLRGLSKVKQVDNEPWAPAVGVESCTRRAIHLVLGTTGASK
jgi:S1-C subfamily serine protease